MNSPRPAAAWKKSSYSKSSYCVEVAQDDGAVAVRDSKHRAAGRILLNSRHWSRFLAAIKSGSSLFR